MVDVVDRREPQLYPGMVIAERFNAGPVGDVGIRIKHRTTVDDKHHIGRFEILLVVARSVQK